MDEYRQEQQMPQRRERRSGAKKNNRLKLILGTIAAVGVSRHPNWLSRVDLPEPDVPMMVTNSPS